MKTVTGGLVIALTAAVGADLMEPESFTLMKLAAVGALMALGLYLMFTE